MASKKKVQVLNVFVESKPKQPQILYVKVHKPKRKPPQTIKVQVLPKA